MFALAITTLQCKALAEKQTDFAYVDYGCMVCIWSVDREADGMPCYSYGAYHS